MRSRAARCAIRRFLSVEQNAVGNTYSGKSQPTTDAIVAFDLKTGRLLWAQGPDFDFGASAAFVNLPDGKDALIAGQKSGIGYALDPDKEGEILWQYRAGRGGTLGGIEWGVAADSEYA